MKQPQMSCFYLQRELSSVTYSVFLVLFSAVYFSKLVNLEWFACESIALLKICGVSVTRAGLNWAELMTDNSILVPIRGIAIKIIWNHMLHIEQTQWTTVFYLSVHIYLASSNKECIWMNVMYRNVSIPNSILPYYVLLSTLWTLKRPFGLSTIRKSLNTYSLL